MKISVREGWREKTQSKASYIFGDKILQIRPGGLDIYSKDSAGEDEGTIILDADFLNNASFEEVVDAITHESIHDAIFKNFRGEVDKNKLTSYWKYDNVQDYVEFWAEAPNSRANESGRKPVQEIPSENWKSVLFKVLIVIIVFLMITAVLL